MFIKKNCGFVFLIIACGVNKALTHKESCQGFDSAKTFLKHQSHQNVYKKLKKCLEHFTTNRNY